MWCVSNGEPKTKFVVIESPDRDYSSSLLHSIITQCLFSKYIQILYIFAQIFKYYPFSIFFALF